MPLVEIQQVTGLSDILLASLFDLSIPTVPGGGDGKALLIRNLTASLPGRKNDPIPVELHRHTTNFAGKRKFAGSFRADFVDASDRAVLKALNQWQDQITDPNTGLPKPKASYATVGMVTIYNDQQQAAEQRIYHGLWVSDVPDIALAGTDDKPITVSVTFTYDYWKPA